jgi:hypothetical protein
VAHYQTMITRDLMRYLSPTMVDVERLTFYWCQMMIDVVNSTEMPSVCYDFYQFPLNFDGNCTEVQSNSLLCQWKSERISS